MDGGGPGGSLPPHKWKVLFKEGGMGTFYPLYYALVDKARKVAAAAAQQQQQQGAPAPFPEPDKAAVEQLVHKA